MMMTYARILAFLLTLLAIATGHSRLLAQDNADDASIRSEILTLATSDQGGRPQALRTLAASRDGRLIAFLKAFNEGSVYLWDDNTVVVCRELATSDDGQKTATLLDPLSAETLVAGGVNLIVPVSELKNVGPSRRERRAVADAIRLLELWSPDLEKRLAAIQRFGSSRDPQFVEPLEQLLASDPPGRVAMRAHKSLLLIRVAGRIPDQTADNRMAALRELGESRAARAVPALQDILKNADDTEFHTAAAAALQKVKSYQEKVRIAQNIFNGLSLGSILILMALGLSIIFGQMGVINMAHGELMMIGAYATYEMQLLFGHSPDNPSNVYFVVAIPVAFLAAAFVGFIIEWLVVRHIYDRPLETLLATWGVGLILIQAARVKYGDNIGVNSPTWLVGALEPVQDLVVPYNRAFILGLCLLSVACVHCLFRFTRLGLLIRATVQGRETAGTLGVNTRRVDGYTFALGSGLAGIAGCAWTLVGGVTPDMGQNHIVDSFLVVVTGGVGKLLGTVLAGLGIGSLNKVLEPMTFGGGLATAGFVVSALCWILITIRAFRHDARWGWVCMLMPFPTPALFAFRTWREHRSVTHLSLYLLGLLAMLLAGTATNDGFLDSPIRAIWAKVLILLCVVVFIQWRPLGLFPPKGRLADA